MKPRVTEDISQCRTYKRSSRQQFRHQILCAFGNVFGVFGILLENALFCVVLVVVVKRQLSTQQSVQDDTQTPNINLFTRVFFSLEHLRRAITHRATPCLQVAGRALVLAREAKVDQLDVAVLVEQDVLQFQVAVDTRFRMDVRDGADQLCEDLLNLSFFHATMFEQVVIQLVASTPFQDQPYQRLGDYDFVKACNVRVEELAMVVDLASEVGVVLLGRLEHNLVKLVV